MASKLCEMWQSAHDASDNGFKGGGGQVPKSETAGPDGYTVNIRKHFDS